MALIEDDGDPIAKSPGGGVLAAYVDPDPWMVVQVDIYRETPYTDPNVDFPVQEKQLAFKAGQKIRQSWWDAEFTTPTIVSIAPATGSTSGGTALTIMGTGFTKNTSGTIGGSAVTSVSVKNPNKLTCVSPSGTSGAKNVVITTAGGSATKTGGFTYS